MSGRKMNENTKAIGAEAADVTRFVTGHDFSRAEHATRNRRALAPERLNESSTNRRREHE